MESEENDSGINVVNDLDSTDEKKFERANHLDLASQNEVYSPDDMLSMSSSASSPKEDTVESLRFEVARLKSSLKQSYDEKHKAAQHGLDILEDKENLLKSYNSLQLEFDKLKDELQLTQQVRLVHFLIILA